DPVAGDAAAPSDGGLDTGVLDDAAVPDIDPVAVKEALCTTYCDTLEIGCETPPQYQTRTACEQVCFRGLESGTPGDDGVDTIECRLTHARAAIAFGEEELECQAAGASGFQGCGDLCDVYCNMV